MDHDIDALHRSLETTLVPNITDNELQPIVVKLRLQSDESGLVVIENSQPFRIPLEKPRNQ
ncbi:hypothetical protein C476_15630 [Natrinema limicola JCM 13563]|uniref:Uncharacterized protein n=1 Tax=Natrinema limicola JCM 13563 TaxID=1230457 RepID=M0C3Z1_9EURY|nr:hypothetical protein C476_15630 [Natrinema limicola JCM 13563]